MSYSIYLALAAATAGPGHPHDPAGQAPPDLDDALGPALQGLRELVERFAAAPLTPLATARFEKDLQQRTRELGRLTAQWAYNHLEPADVRALPAEVRFAGVRYRRLAKKTPQPLSTLFGLITLHRLGYRTGPLQGEPVLFPLCRQLGTAHGATPALYERVAHYQAEAGATQQQTLRRLREQHGLSWGVKRLRQVVAWVAQALEEQRPAQQVEQVLAWLGQAQASRGPHKPVLSAGRDGTTLGLRIQGGTLREVATAATLSVYDRRGRRLGTVYLAYAPQAGQHAMSAGLTRLLREVLKGFRGPRPRLSYVSDAGDNETAYYRRVLRWLRHPVTGERLRWQWVVDYYHASLRLSALGEALFGAGPRSQAWARTMRRLLLQPGGVGRVLHSAAALRGRLRPRGRRGQDFARAYRYLQQRRRHLRYAQYRRLGVPIGSGVTEAACKTVYGQRLKLSGMRWQGPGAQVILNLRVALLSGVWQQAFERALRALPEVQTRAPAQKDQADSRKRAS